MSGLQGEKVQFWEQDVAALQLELQCQIKRKTLFEKKFKDFIPVFVLTEHTKTTSNEYELNEL